MRNTMVTVPTVSTRAQRVQHISTVLPGRAALVNRLLARNLRCRLSRTEVGLLHTLSYGQRRITELAETEGLAQPTTTLLVKRLEQVGLVARARAVTDGRVVLVSLTAAGTAALEDYHDQAVALLRDHLAEMSDEQVEQLAASTDALAALIDVLQRDAGR